MTTALLDFSRRAELRLHAGTVADVEAAAASLSVVPLIVGAFARDLLLHYAHAIETRRSTEDLDFAVAVARWADFEALRQRLLDSGRFTATATAHRLRHRNRLPIDLVPFDRVEGRNRTIAWPPRGDTVMDVFGFREAAATALAVALPGGVTGRVVSLPALSLLKLVAWSDRRHSAPRKDAHDLYLVLRNYLDAGNRERLFGEFLDWTQADDFDYEPAGARMLGRDLRALLDPTGTERVTRLLEEQASREIPAPLPAEMEPMDPDRPRELLAAMLKGLTEVA